jgi:transposase
MPSVELQEQQWQRVLKQLQALPGVYVGQESDCRRFVEAVLWIDKTGAQWRELPAYYGNWNSVFKRFNRWSKKGIWQQLSYAVADLFDWENVAIDSTVIRAHPCAAGAKGGLHNKD